MSAERSETAFALTYEVQASIRAEPSVVWARLTDASAYPTWNGTVTRLDGEIALGSRLAIEVPIAPGRVFRPRVVGWSPPERMEWRDGFAPMFRGTRTFELAPDEQGTRFVMRERFAGLMLPMIRRSLPDFRPAFDRFASDLRRACEG